jgi:hypothetical protein
MYYSDFSLSLFFFWLLLFLVVRQILYHHETSSAPDFSEFAPIHLRVGSFIYHHWQDAEHFQHQMDSWFPFVTMSTSLCTPSPSSPLLIY